MRSVVPVVSIAILMALSFGAGPEATAGAREFFQCLSAKFRTSVKRPAEPTAQHLEGIGYVENTAAVTAKVPPPIPVRPAAELSAILDLPIAQRIALLHQEGDGSRAPEVEAFLKLACYQEEAWIAFVGDVSVHGFPVMDHLAPYLRLFRALPEPQRTIVLKKIGKNLRGTKKGLLSSPNRFLKLMVKELLDVPSILALYSRDPVKGMQEYFDLLHASLPDHPASGTYTAEQVIAAAREIQKMIPKMRFLPGPPESRRITLYGSFPNGLADLSRKDSDLDLLSDGRFSRIEMDLLADRIRELLSSPVHLHPFWGSHRLPGLSAATPIAIDITETGISVLTFGSPGRDGIRYPAPLQNSYLVPGGAGPGSALAPSDR